MRKRYGIMLGILLVVLAVCTYVAGQVYQKNLPKITAEWSVATQLRYQWDISGTLHYEVPAFYSVPAAAEVVRVMVQPGKWVAEGDVLLELDTELLYQEWLKCKVNEEALEKQIAGSNSYVKEMLEYQYASLQETLQQLEGLLEDNGFVYASEDGIILSAVKSGGAVANAALVTQGTATGRKQMTFLLDSKQASYCNAGTILKVTLVQEEAENESDSTQEVSETEVYLSVDRVFYSAAQQQYQCVVTTDAPLNMMEGQPVTAQLSATSTSYQIVIPTAAVIANNNGNASFFVLGEKNGIMGEEKCAVLESGYILEQNETYTALSASVTDKVITSWSAPLTDGCTVRE